MGCETDAPKVEQPKRTSGSGSSVEEVLPYEPPALVYHQHEIKMEENPADAQETGHEKRYVVSTGLKQGSADIRLHGRWMELSTHKLEGSIDGVSKSRKTKRISRRVESQIFTPTGILDRFCPVIQPTGRLRLAWDATGLLLIMLDAFVLPVTLAWNLEEGWGSPGSMFLLLTIWVSVFFWFTDLFLNLLTGFYRNGKLVSERKEIVVHYVKTWLTFDLALLTLDFVNVSTEVGDLAALRYARLVRGFRLLRLLKMSKLQDMLQEVAASTGRQWIMLVIAIVNTSFVALVCAHVLTCVWFALGIAAENDNIISWLRRSGAYGEAFEAGVSNVVLMQYLHSLRYVINVPSPPDLSPESFWERVFDIAVYVFVLVVIGASVSGILSTVNELQAMNEAAARQRREVRMYLTSQSASLELVSRIMKFVDYKLARTSLVTFDPSLISKTLQTELFVGQRSRFLERLPVFKLTSDLFPDVFAGICAALSKNVYEQKESVFMSGAWSTSLHVTAAGLFLHTEEGCSGEEVEGERWFGELSLYSEATIHRSTLLAKTFAEVYALTGKDLADCVRDSPGCTSMFCEYAKDFVSSTAKVGPRMPLEDQAALSEQCCKGNQFYQVLYPDPQKLFHNVNVAERVHEAMVRDKRERNATISMGITPETPQAKIMETSQVLSAESALNRSESERSEIDPGLTELLLEVQNQGLMETLAKELESRIPELHARLGSHAIFEQLAERDRAISSCISILALVHDRYDIFTQPQPAAVKLRPDQWQELQKMVQIISPDLEQLHAVVVLLSIRALGKNKTVSTQVPKDMQRPERAVVHLMDNVRNVVPSVLWLSHAARNYAHDALNVHETFNLAQMLQGENAPANVRELYQLVNEQGQSSFNFYMLFLLGFMSGLAGGEGSRFMNSKNAEAVISGFVMLRNLLSSPPQEIYWGYMVARARALKIPFETRDDLVLIRLACLSRLQDAGAYAKLLGSWNSLGQFQKKVLIDHFLADGIETQAFVLEFLPMCVANAKANGLIGMTLLLEVLVELLTNLKQAVRGLKDAHMMHPVDLSDMSEFIAAVQNRFVFQTCVSRCLFKFSGYRITVEMTGRNWGRTNDADSDLTSLAYEVKGILANQKTGEHF